MPDDYQPITIAADVWLRLAAAAADPKHPWHWPAVATAGSDGRPAVRTLVLREVDIASRTLAFFTDVRSPKVQMLRADPRVEFCFNDGSAGAQLRIAATATVMSDGPEVDARWETVPEPTRAAYAQISTPGTELETWIPKPATSGIDGRRNFAIVGCAVQEIDWLKLDPVGHRRIRFTYAANGPMQFSWLAP